MTRLLFALVLCGCATVPVRGVVPAPVGDDAASLDAFVQASLQAGDGVGLSVSVLKGGVVVLQKGYGRRALEPDAPVELNTPFAIGSVSKQFTVAALLLLAEEGKLSVDDPVSKWFPSLTRASGITLLDLMHHVSGYSDYYPLDYLDRRMLEAVPTDAVIARYAGRALEFEPRSRYSYSNTGYLILGRVIELVSGEPLAAFEQRRLFGPLGLTHTSVHPDGAPSGGEVARGYTRFALGPTQAAVTEAGGWLGGAAAMWSTAADLSTWGQALLTGKVLTAASLRVMTTPVRLSNGATLRYAGVLVGTSKDNVAIWSHSGAVNGFRAVLTLDAAGTSVAVLANFDDFDVGAVAEGLFGAVRPVGDVPVVTGPGPVEVARTVVAQFQAGSVDRRVFTEEFARFLTTERLANAKAALAPWGLPSEAALIRRSERGGLEVAVVELHYEVGSLRVTMYRRPDGTIEQVIISRVVSR